MSHPSPTHDPENILPEDLGEDDETTQDKMIANAYVESLETLPKKDKIQNEFIQNQVRDILKLTADHNIRMATKSPAVQMDINIYGEPLTASVDRIINIGKKL